MRILNRFLAVAGLSAVAAGLLGAPAQAATPAAHGKEIRYCKTVVDGPKEASKVVSRTCSADKGAPALAAAPAETVLITFFEDAGYVGYYDSVYGKYGACDSSGYGFSDLTGVQLGVNGISSYYYYNNCNVQRLYTDTYYGGTASGALYGDRFYVGDTFNDNVWSMRVWHN
ncbi:hypothetical protein [Amycolatopsis mediterranei]|uniref:hypothetical protein n=1 Tax=Amycolatopsis mediterranei TaxID=33910 RepID=UPI001E630A0D|nr:hypothetical protein [Amycolatopsis mediterranei]UZF73174.1 hypothetical protein ISP_006590 [Amycolatopsis mediterranei]